ncbi:hypothetical protein SAMN05443633_1128 [Chryseobacterium arachidis]|uniref:Uncharacterized protein n=2 Tax=Chryseobacterium arachidis TaxID=1416778 RepID=A0A1M5I684_9FLAO|nr:hypothetical protein [Chryseobacterium arachidis]SHG23702.1 hypothetical protein SAMN05443633_1128 [Chryseobacterium arachidis]
MKILKSTFFRPRKCQYGNFELSPDKGWEILQSFIDFESGLLVVSTIKSKEDRLKSGVQPETKQYLINLQSLQILFSDDYKEYFDYGLNESYSPDGKLRLISQRIHDKQRNNDFFAEKLYDTKMGTLISSGESLAFTADRRENLLKRHYATLKLKQESQLNEAEKLSLSDLESIHKAVLKKDEPIISFFDEFYCYKLIHTGTHFEILRYSLNGKDSENIPAYLSTFLSIEDFWKEIATDPNWFRALSIEQQESFQPFVLSRKVLETFNSLKKEKKLSYEQLEKIYGWEKVFIHQDLKPGEVKQFCSNCTKEVRYNPRYPKYICSICSSKDKYSQDGMLLEFYNTDLSGGLKIVYKDIDGNVLREDDSKAECLCLIDGKEFTAQEARFGGIVIQKK